MKSRLIVPLLTRQHGLLKRRFQLWFQSRPTNQSTKSKKRKAPSLEDILYKFRLINKVFYTLFQIEQL